MEMGKGVTLFGGLSWSPKESDRRGRAESGREGRSRKPRRGRKGTKGES